MRQTCPIRFIVLVALVIASAIGMPRRAAGQLTLVGPSSYDMLNGEVGSYEYWDESYNGSGSVTTSLDPLTGGLGDLTDGVATTDNWYVSEPPPGNGPYVGWTSIDPKITFRFSSVQTFKKVLIHVDDSNSTGGVEPPSKVRVSGGGFSVTKVVNDPADGAPFWVKVKGLSIVSKKLNVKLYRGAEWVFADEVQFYVPAPAAPQGRGTPEPGSLALLGAASVPALCWLRSRFRR